MFDFNETEIRRYYESRCGGQIRKEGKQWMGRCPVHNGDGLNLKINPKTGQSYCQSQCRRGWDIYGIEQEIFGLSFPKAKESVYETIGRPRPSREEAEIEATYDYTDENGKLLYQVVRRTGKKFSQRRPDGKGGWHWGLPSQRVPFGLPRIAKAGNSPIFVVEGEKDARTLASHGWIATCNNGGAGNFHESLAFYFTGKIVGIIPDNDEPGRKHAQKVAAVLKPVAQSVRIVELPDLPAKGDVTDFLNAGHDIEEVAKAYEAAPEWSDAFDYGHEVPDPEAIHGLTLVECIAKEGGLEQFWDFTSNQGVPTPFPRLTEAIGGMVPEEYYVIGADQGTGKTSLAIQFTLSAMLANKGVLYFSLEMGHRQMFQRLLSIDARVDLWNMRRKQRSGKTEDDRDVSGERIVLDRSLEKLKQHYLRVDTKARITSDYITRRVEALRNKREPIDLVIVDHMQLMASTGSERSDYEKFTAIAHALKAVSKEANCPVVVVSQTNRGPNRDKRSRLCASDLRGAGAIEEDAAGIFLLYVTTEERQQAEQEPSPYGMDGDRLRSRFVTGPVKTILQLEKNRYGIGGMMLELMHDKRYTRFDEVTRC